MRRHFLRLYTTRTDRDTMANAVDMSMYQASQHDDDESRALYDALFLGAAVGAIDPNEQSGGGLAVYRGAGLMLYHGKGFDHHAEQLRRAIAPEMTGEGFKSFLKSSGFSSIAKNALQSAGKAALSQGVSAFTSNGGNFAENLKSALRAGAMGAVQAGGVTAAQGVAKNIVAPQLAKVVPAGIQSAAVGMAQSMAPQSPAVQSILASLA